MNINNLYQFFSNDIGSGSITLSTTSTNQFAQQVVRELNTALSLSVDNQILISDAVLTNNISTLGTFLLEGKISGVPFEGDSNISLTFGVKVDIGLKVAVAITAGTGVSYIPNELISKTLNEPVFNFESVENDGVVRATINGILANDNIAVELDLSNESGNVLSMNTSGDDFSLESLNSATSFLGLSTDSNIVDQFPEFSTDRSDDLGDINLQNFNLNFDGTNAITEATVVISLGEPLEIIPDQLVLRDLKFELRVTNPTDTTSRQFFPKILGGVSIGDKVGIDASILRNTEDANVWEFSIARVEERPIGIPSISDILAIGGVTTTDLPEAVQFLTGIKLNGLEVAFQATDFRINSFNVDISSSSSWEIIPQIIELDNVNIQLNIDNNETAGLEINSGAISTTWGFGGGFFNVSANALKEDYGNDLESKRTWNLVGMVEEPLDFKAFLESHIDLPENFPALSIQTAKTTISQANKTFMFEGEAILGNENLELTIDVDARYGSVAISGGFGEDRTFSFTDLTALFGVDLASALPEGITADILGGIGLRQFDLEFNFLQGAIERFAFVIGAENEITLIDDTLSLTPTLEFEVINPTGDREIRLDIFGEWVIGESQVDVSVSVFDRIITAGIVNGQPIDVSALVEAVIPSDVTLPSLAIEDFNFVGKLSESDYELKLRATSGFELDFAIAQLALQEIDFYLNIEGGSLSQFNLEGRVEFLAIPLVINADFEDDAWSFSGGTPMDEEVRLESIFEELKTNISVLSGADINASLPSVIQDLTISNFRIAYNAATSTTSFGIEIADPLKFSDNFDIDLITVDLAVTSGGLMEIPENANAEGMSAGQAPMVSSTGLQEGSSVEMLATFAGIDITLSARKEGEGFLFRGGIQEGVEIPVGMLIGDLIEKFDSNVKIPAALDALVIDSLSVTYNSGTSEFMFECGLMTTIGNVNATNIFMITVAKQGEGANSGYAISISNQTKILLDDNGNGQLDEGETELQFDILFEHSTSNTLIAALYTNQGAPALNIKSLVSAAAGREIDIPEIELSLDDIIFVYDKDSGQSTFLLGVDLDASLSLSGLPLVGKAFSGDLNASIDGFRVYYSTQAFTEGDTSRINAFVTNDNFEGIPEMVSKGLNLMGRLSLGSTSREFSYVIGGGGSPSGGLGDELPTGSAAETTSTPTPGPVAPSDDADAELAGSDRTVKWFNIQKSFGPVHLGRAGIEYNSDNQSILILLDGGMELGPLQVELFGLGIGSSLTSFSPKFNLDGLGISFEAGVVSIKGGLLRVPLPNPGDFQFDGFISIVVPSLSISAIGSFARFQGQTSLFIYGAVTIPAGGPIFFQLKGLSFGFGYNRALIVPSLNNVLDFPLVSIAVNAADLDIRQVLTSLNKYIPPSIGEYWVAAGITFNSFKIIDAFVLLTIAFGRGFELNLIGIATIVLPPEAGANPIAQIQLAIRVGFSPTEGWLQVEAQLTRNSYIISKDARLTGGFAFYAWFKDQENGASEGEIVVSIGGYNPFFDVPDYYPVVPRLGLSWRLSNIIMVKGGMYFALTTHAMMAGGEMEMTLNGKFGPARIEAWLNAGIHILLIWKPFYYDFRVFIHIRVRASIKILFTIRLNLDIRADLRITGPEFSGSARLKVGPVSFTVRFGAGEASPKPISWDEFRTSFLPEESAGGLTINAEKGLLKTVKVDNKEILVMNAVDMSILTGTQIPIKKAFSDDESLNISEFNTSSFGVGPVAITPGELNSEFRIKVRDEDGDSLMTDLALTPIQKNMPISMWGTSLRADVNKDRQVTNTLAGYEIKPGTPPAGGMSGSLPKEALQSSIEGADISYKWATVDYTPDTTVLGELQSVHADRDSLAKLLYPDFKVDLDEGLTDRFRATPVGLEM